jgi:hypothetical protein
LADFITQFIPSTVQVHEPLKRAKTRIYLVLSDDIKTYQRIIEKFPQMTFIINKNATTIPQSLMEKSNIKERYMLNPEVDLPESCFLSINLNTNISADIYKLGKRGIRTINNEGTPYSLEYTDLNSIYKIIMNEMIEEHDRDHDRECGSEITVVEEYTEVDFYQYPFEKHYSVCITYLAKDLYKIQNTTPVGKYSTPGIYTRHYLNLNQKYLIKIRGYKLFNTNGGGGGMVHLWIAQAAAAGDKKHKQTILFDPQNSLPGTYRECGVINYIFHNTIAENNFYIGLLFQNAKENDAFIFQSLQVIQLCN